MASGGDYQHYSTAVRRHLEGKGKSKGKGNYEVPLSLSRISIVLIIFTMISSIINKVVSFINNCNLEVSEWEFCEEDREPYLMVRFKGGEQVFIIIIYNFSINNISYNDDY